MNSEHNYLKEKLSQHLLVQGQQWKNQNNLRNLV